MSAAETEMANQPDVQASFNDLALERGGLSDKLEQPQFRPNRKRLPDTRRSITHKFSISGHEGYITAGLYDDGTPGEVFIKMAKMGSTVSGLVDTIAVLTSLALQYGVPVTKLASKFEHTRFEPSGHTTNSAIPMANSISDYLFRWLGRAFTEESGNELESGDDRCDPS
jgi:ribonucleoside-diphosphate reductase alpha chain